MPHCHINGQLLQDEAQFQQLCIQLRRYGHMSEGTRGNVAQLLHGHNHQARPGAYYGADNQQREAYRSAADTNVQQGGAFDIFMQLF